MNTVHVLHLIRN